MADHTQRTDSQVTNSERSLNALSGLMPDADPAALLATATEMAKISDAIKNMQDLGLVAHAAGHIVLKNGNIVNFHQRYETEEE